ncbi:MAG TPA: winged helix-turn-helix domain-containing protein [Steroidobacteraceae bacterium]
MNAPVDIRANQQLELGFQFGELWIDPRAGEVSGPAGHEKLDPKVMDVLVMLAQHAGQVVLREHLLARLWPNAVVTDDVLSRCIYELRRQLSRAGGDEQYKAMVDTVPKRGYRLNGEVALPQARSSARTKRLSNRLVPGLTIMIAAAVLLWLAFGREMTGPAAKPPPATPAANSIAVLAFVDMSPDQDQKYLSDGFAEEIINRLAQSKDLRVISRTSSFSFRDRPVDIPEIAARLNVSHVLEGSLRRSGDKLRITAQLIAASSNSHVWSETYNRAVGDLFDIQDEIAASVAIALQGTLGGGAARNRTPASLEAHERYLQGHFFYNRRAPGDIERSARYFEDAVSIDPQYARAWAALSGASSLLASTGGPSSREWRKRQGDAARKSVELDPDLAVAHARLGQYYFQTADRKLGEEHFQKAFALDPDDPLVLGAVAVLALRRGDPEGAIAAQRRVVAQDPLSFAQRQNLAMYLLADGRLDEAASGFRKTLELSPDADLEIETEIVRIFVAQQRYDEAQSAVARLPEGKFRDHGLALLYRAPGSRAEADIALKRLAAQPGDAEDSIRLAETYAFRGMSDAAFASLQAQKAVLERDGDPSSRRIWEMQDAMRFSYFLTPLHSDPRWVALMTEPD